MSEIKRIDIKEFRTKGFLQEVNRQFFHPLGLALEVIIDEDTGNETLGGIWDYRDDPEGIFFLDNLINEERIRSIDLLRQSKVKCRVDAAAKKDGIAVGPSGVQIKCREDRGDKK